MIPKTCQPRSLKDLRNEINNDSNSFKELFDSIRIQDQ